jgi:imidazolonepropionase-like amidohydrolase
VNRRFVIYLLLCIVALLVARSTHAEAPAIFTGATLIDGTGRPPLESATLVIQGGRIVAVGPADAEPYTKQPGATFIDCTGQTIMPALISDHSHLGVVKDGKVSSENYTKENIESALRQYEGYGVTAVLALGVNKDVLYAWRAGNLPGADVFTADHGLGVQHAAPPPFQSERIRSAVRNRPRKLARSSARWPRGNPT